MIHHPQLSTPFSLNASRANLLRVALIRLIVIAGQLGGILFAHFWLQAKIAYLPLLSGVAALAVVTALTFWRLRREREVSDTEFFVHLLCDISLLTAMLYFSGGITNPFVSYYLVPICVAAAVLPVRFTITLTALSLGAHTLLLFHYQPLDFLMPHPHRNGPQLHLVGMWFDFTISAGLITVFVSSMANVLRRQQQELNQRREDALRQQQLVSVATLAAGTAHELGTPLSTMTVLVDELIADCRDQPALAEDLGLLRQQLGECRATLKKLVATAETHQHGARGRAGAREFLRQTLDRWQVMRPEARYHWRGDSADAEVPADPVLEQALLNLLNNAADASPGAVDISLQCHPHEVVISVGDRGHHRAPSPQPFASTKSEGLGLGLFLSRAAVERYGGHLSLVERPGGGSVARLVLPTAMLASEASSEVEGE